MTHSFSNRRETALEVEMWQFRFPGLDFLAIM